MSSSPVAVLLSGEYLSPQEYQGVSKRPSLVYASIDSASEAEADKL